MNRYCALALSIVALMGCAPGIKKHTEDVLDVETQRLEYESGVELGAEWETLGVSAHLAAEGVEEIAVELETSF